MNRNERAISSDDPQAVPKLKTKLESLEALQAHMKQVNTAFRKNGLQGIIPILGDEAATALVAAMRRTPWEKKPYASWALSNNNANIKRTRARIAELEAQADRQAVKEVHDGFTYQLDPDDNRVRFSFDGIPSPETRSLLKRHGFKWAPSVGAWQRQATQNGIATAEYLKPQLIEKLAA